ncbi:MAG TPA: hypothetical protein VNI02_06420 [Blastocatellia bacterium]|jgi:hypothetical protein|nr:hypothetical protein [Blastocatellia bacterium]
MKDKKQDRGLVVEQLTVNVTRRFRVSLLIVIVMAIFIPWINIPGGMAGAVQDTKGPVFDILPDNSLSTLAAASPRGATFYLQGTIYEFRTFNQADCTPLFSGADLQKRALGTWRAWGTVADNGSRLVLHQTLSFSPIDKPPDSGDPLNGTIEVQGVNGIIAPNGSVMVVDAKGNTTGPSEVLSVVGGSGRFSGLSGEAIIRPYCNPTPAGTSPFRFDRAFCLGVE